MSPRRNHHPRHHTPSKKPQPRYRRPAPIANGETLARRLVRMGLAPSVILEHGIHN